MFFICDVQEQMVLPIWFQTFFLRGQEALVSHLSDVAVLVVSVALRKK